MDEIILEFEINLRRKKFYEHRPFFLQGSVRLPDKATMWSDIRQKEATMARQYVKSTRHTIQVDYIPFMDELAAMMGCKPDISKSPWQREIHLITWA